jgi:hypothetical protein
MDLHVIIPGRPPELVAQVVGDQVIIAPPSPPAGGDPDLTNRNSEDLPLDKIP